MENKALTNIFFISDFHFDHKNILKYVPSRPFKDVEEMNKVMLDNYNRVIKDDSLVFFLGGYVFW